MQNEKIYAKWLERLLILFVIAGCVFSFKTLYDRTKYLSRNSAKYEAYIDLLIGNIRGNFVLKNSNIKLNNILISENGDTLHLDDIMDENITTFFLSSSLGCNECNQIQLQIVDEFNNSKGANIIVMFNKQSRRELSLYKRMNKVKSMIYVCDFNKEVNDILLGGPIILKMNREFSMLDVFRPIKQLPELTKSYIQTIQQDINDK